MASNLAMASNLIAMASSLIAMAPNLEAMAHKGPEDPETRLRETRPVAAFLDFQASEYHIVREHGCKRFLHTSLSQSYAGLD